MKHYTRRAPEGLDPKDNWRDHAACIGKGNIFLPRDEHHAPTTEPKKICAACPVRLPCLEAAMKEEGTADQFRRAGVRGGLTPAERAALGRRTATGAVERLTAAEQAREEAQAKNGQAIDMIRKGGATDSQVAAAVGLSSHTIGKIRRELGIPVQPVPKTIEETYAERTETVDGGHVRWTSVSQQATLNGRTYTPARLAFLLGHGREPEGWVYVSCDRPGCVEPEHLTDRPMREQARQAVKA
jgi:transcription factor WhiB